MQNQKVVLTMILGLLAIPLMGAVTSAQEIPDAPGEPEVAACASPAAMGALFNACNTGIHTYRELIEHGPQGSVVVWTNFIATAAPVSSMLQVEDSSSWTGWRTVHKIECDSMADTIMDTVDPDACEETGEIPEPGTTVRHRCSTSSLAVGVVVCSIAYLK